MGQSADPRASFDAFYRENARAVMAFCASRSLEAQDAADAVSETFLRALAGRDRFDAALGTPTSWLFGIAVNVIRDQQRGRSRSAALRDRLGVERLTLVESDVAEYAELRADAGAVLEALASLPEDERALLLDRQLEGTSYADLHLEHDLPTPSAARKRVSRSLAELRGIVRKDR